MEAATAAQAREMLESGDGHDLDALRILKHSVDGVDEIIIDIAGEKEIEPVFEDEVEENGAGDAAAAAVA